MTRTRTLAGAALWLAIVATGPLGSIPAAAQDAPTGTLSVAFEGDITSLDPAIGYDYLSWPAERLLFETLVAYGDDSILEPALAATMPEVSADGLTYTITLRDDVDFVRDGEVVRGITAADVAHSLNRLLRPDLLPYPSPIGETFFGNVVGAAEVIAGEAETATGIEAIDERTVRITLTQPDRTFMNILATPFASVVPAETGLDGAAFFTDAVGTGPFYLESYTAGEKAMFRANPHYWQEGLPLVDAVEYRLMVPASTAVQQALANELDITGDQLQPAEWEQLTADPALEDRLVVDAQPYVLYLAMDTTGEDSPFTDVRVRQAVQHAIDKENIVRITSGRGTVASCIQPAAIPGHDPACAPYDHDPEAARALLAEAGAEGISTQLYTDTTDISVLEAESIAADLAAVGIEAEVVAQEWDTLLGTLNTPHAVPMVLIGWYADYPDPSNFIDPILSCATAVEGGANFSLHCDESIDADSAALRTVADLDEAIPGYQDIERRIMANAPIVPLIVQGWSAVKSDRVTGFDHLHPVWTHDLAAYGLAE